MDNTYSNLLITKYRFSIYHKFLKALDEYNLIEPNDKIMVCVSGGKDSFLMALCFKEIKKWTKIPFDVSFVCMNPGYTKETLNEIITNSKLLDIPLEIFETNIFNIALSQDDKKCYICAKMRRGALYNKAKELGYNKIALGQHYDDQIETTLMSILYSGKVETMLPKVLSDNYQGLSLIRPMYLVREDDIINYSKEANINFLKGGCFATSSSSLCSNSKRQYVKELIKKLKENNPNIDKNIFKSTENVNIDKVVGYKKGKEHYSIRRENKEQTD